jgi:hypothetical protein
MLSLFLFFCFLSFGDLRTEKQLSSMSESQNEPGTQRDLSATAISCEETLKRAISLNESFKNAVSAGGQRAFGQEAEKYYNTVLLKNISGCVTYATVHSDVALSRLLFELAYQYSNSPDKVIDLELARFFSRNQEMTRTILLDYEKNKRHELIEILKRGLDNLYYVKADEASQLKELKQSLDELD